MDGGGRRRRGPLASLLGDRRAESRSAPPPFLRRPRDREIVAPVGTGNRVDGGAIVAPPRRLVIVASTAMAAGHRERPLVLASAAAAVAARALNDKGGRSLLTTVAPAFMA